MLQMSIHREAPLCLAAGLQEDAGVRGDSLTNADAERVLLRVKQKLEGLEGGDAALSMTHIL